MNNKGSAFIWIMVLIGLFLFGITYGILDPLMNQMQIVGIDSNVPAEQLGIEENLWQYLPLIVLIAFAVWGLTEGQRREQ